MNSSVPVRIHLNVSDDELTPRSSIGSHLRSPLSTSVTLAKNKLSTNVVQTERFAARFSSVSSSYAQFLKQRDMDKVKKIVSCQRKTKTNNKFSSIFIFTFCFLFLFFQLSQEDQRLLLSSSEWVEDVKDSDPYISVISRLGKNAIKILPILSILIR